MSEARLIAERSTILRATVGSTVHGLNLEGTDDMDEMGICVESSEFVIGLQHFEQWVHRTQPEGVRSGPGDLDLTVYSLRKWTRLALKGNPTILLLLFVPDSACSVLKPAGQVLRELSPLIVSRQVAAPYLGYLTAQKERLLGIRGQKRVKRPDLEDAHGYDTKYAMHALRLGYQGRELLTTGRMTLPMREDERTDLMSVRRGGWSLQHVLTVLGEFERELKDLADTSPLPPAPDVATVERFLVSTYLDAWAKNSQVSA